MTDSNPKNRYLFLLVSLFALLLVSPLVGNSPVIRHLLSAAVTLLLASGVYSVSYERKHFIAAGVLGATGFFLIAANSVYQSTSLAVILLTVEILFFSYIACVMLSRILGEPVVSSDTIIGSVCVYLLIGISFAFFYMYIELLSPGSFSNTSAVVDGSGEGSAAFLYFSLVTLSTVGYGDVVPLTDFARTLAGLEGIIGQMYIAILIARLVAIHTMQNRELR